MLTLTNKLKVTENNTIDPYSSDAITIRAVAAWTKINTDYGTLPMKGYYPRNRFSGKWLHSSRCYC